MRSALKAVATTVAFLMVVVCGAGSGATLAFGGHGVQVAMGTVAVLVSLATGVRLMFVGLEWAFEEKGRGRHA